MRLEYPYIQAGRYKRGRKHAPEFLVLHWSAGDGDDDAIADYFVNPRKKIGVDDDGETIWGPRDASYHFAGGRWGSTVQMVDTDDTAWHSGGGTDWLGRKEVNDRSIGICLANRGPIKAARAKVLGPQRVYIGPHTKPGFHGYGKLFEGFPVEQRDALTHLIERIVKVHPTVKMVCGHEDLVKGKGDPGPAFNVWDPQWARMGLTRRVKDWKSGRWAEWKPQG